MSHAHTFRRFLLYDMFYPSAWRDGTPPHTTVKVFTDQRWRPGDYFYRGYECRCGEPGFGVSI